MYTLKDANAEMLAVNVEFITILANIKDQLETVKKFILITDEGSTMSSFKVAYAGEYEALLAAAPASYDFPDFDENTRATTFYTTGTTGAPKGVYFSHRQLVLHTLATMGALAGAAQQGRVHRDDVYMPITPMFHVMAWGVPYIAVMLGLKTVLPGRYLPDVLLRLRREEKVTFSHCVPTILQMLLQGAAASGQDLSGWKVIIGGSALSPALCKAARDQGMDVFAGYGMSETGPVVSLAQFPPNVTPADAGEDVKKRASTGRPILMVDFRVVDADMNDVPRDGKSQGEIVLRSPSLTQLYFKKPEASEELWAGGYLHTQDVAVVMGEVGGQGGMVVRMRVVPIRARAIQDRELVAVRRTGLDGESRGTIGGLGDGEPVPVEDRLLRELVLKRDLREVATSHPNRRAGRLSRAVTHDPRVRLHTGRNVGSDLAPDQPLAIGAVDRGHHQRGPLRTAEGGELATARKGGGSGGGGKEITTAHGETRCRCGGRES